MIITKMKKFPNALNVDFKNNFSDIYNDMVLCKLRQDVFDHIIGESENSYFDIDKFTTSYKHADMKCVIYKQFMPEIMNELNNLGWKCKLSFGGTALFIYSSEDPPPSCWDDGLI